MIPRALDQAQSGFNEAAAYHCGKHATRRASTSRSAGGFNEAAAYHCGKLEPWKFARHVAPALQ